MINTSRQISWRSTNLSTPWHPLLSTVSDVFREHLILHPNFLIYLVHSRLLLLLLLLPRLSTILWTRSPLSSQFVLQFLIESWDVFSILIFWNLIQSGIVEGPVSPGIRMNFIKNILDKAVYLSITLSSFVSWWVSLLLLRWIILQSINLLLLLLVILNKSQIRRVSRDWVIANWSFVTIESLLHSRHFRSSIFSSFGLISRLQVIPLIKIIKCITHRMGSHLVAKLLPGRRRLRHRQILNLFTSQISSRRRLLKHKVVTVFVGVSALNNFCRTRTHPSLLHFIQRYASLIRFIHQLILPE